MQTRNNFRKVAAWLFMLGGAAALGVWVSSYVAENIYESRENRVFDEERSAREAAKTSEPVAPEVREGGLVGRLSIPRLNVRAVIREGATEKTLSIALGHIPGTSFPGPAGNVGVAGHRDRLFRELRHIRMNDSITLETPSGVYNYEVESLRVVKPTDVQVLKASDHPQLTLVTCYPFEYIGSAPNRYIVKARLVSSALVNPSEGEPVPMKKVALEGVPGPAPVTATAKPQPAEAVTEPRPRPSGAFTVPEGHSRELVPGKIWFGLSSTDQSQQRVNGWVWVMPERRTYWMESVDVGQPFVFNADGQVRRLTITSIKTDSATGSISQSQTDSASEE